MRKYYFIILFPIHLIMGCGEGIEPGPEENIEQTGFGGTVYFVGEWPDTVRRTFIVAFRNEIKNAGDFVLQLGFISDSIPNNTNQVIYTSLINPLLPITPGEYNYVVVAQSATPEISLIRKDWRVVGVYYANGDTSKPGKLIINQNDFVRDINITCDFDNPPPQPPL